MGFAEEALASDRVCYTLRSKRYRFHYYEKAPALKKSDLPDVIIEKRKTPEPGQNPFHRTVQGDINGHTGTGKKGGINTTACAFKSGSALHPIHGFDLRQTLFANKNSSPVTWMGSGAMGPGEFEIDKCYEWLEGNRLAGNSMFKIKGSAGMPTPREDWRTIPYNKEDWTKVNSLNAKEKNRYLVSPFKDKSTRQLDKMLKKAASNPLGPGTYKVPADNCTNKTAISISSSLVSKSHQIAPFIPPDCKAEAADYQKMPYRDFEHVGRNSPMFDTTGRASPAFANKVPLGGYNVMDARV